MIVPSSFTDDMTVEEMTAAYIADGWDEDEAKSHAIVWHLDPNDPDVADLLPFVL